MADFESLLGKIGKGEIEIESKTEDLPPYPKPSKTRANNMTIIIPINTKINVGEFYDNIKLPSHGDKNASKKRGIISIKAGKGEEKGLVKIPVYKSRKRENDEKKIGSKKAKKKNGAFRNQVCVIIRPPWYTTEELKNKNRQKEKGFNIKIFTNGTLHITGPRSIEDAQKAAEIVIKKLKKTKNAVDHPEKLKIGNYKISMINAGFSVNFEIDRTKVYNILKKEYKLTCTPHKPRYQGVNVKFFYNEHFDEKLNNGLCHCKCLTEKQLKKLQDKGRKIKCLGQKECDGSCTSCSCSFKYFSNKKKEKGNGYELNSCRCISILIFGSGEILVTGGTSFEQVQHVYNFINKVYKKHYATICVPRETGTFIKKDGVVSKSIVKSNPQKHKDEKEEHTNQRMKKVKILLL